jgi:hypothetical protein
LIPRPAPTPVVASKENRASGSLCLKKNLAHFCTNKNFVWEWSPPNGRSRGILVGFKRDKFEVLDFLQGNFSLKFKMSNKEDSFEWCFTAV